MMPDHENDELQSLLQADYGAPPLDQQFSAALVEKLQAAVSTDSPSRQQRWSLVLWPGTVAVAASLLAIIWLSNPTETKLDSSVVQQTQTQTNAEHGNLGAVIELNQHSGGTGTVPRQSEVASSTDSEVETYKAPGASSDLPGFDGELPGGDSSEKQTNSNSLFVPIGDLDIREITREGAARLGWKITVDEEKGHVRFTVQPPAELLSQGRTAHFGVWQERKLIVSCLLGLHERKQGSRYEFAVSNQYLAGATFELGSAEISGGSESYRMHLDKLIDQP